MSLFKYVYISRDLVGLICVSFSNIQVSFVCLFSHMYTYTHSRRMHLDSECLFGKSLFTFIGFLCMSLFIHVCRFWHIRTGTTNESTRLLDFFCTSLFTNVSVWCVSFHMYRCLLYVSFNSYGSLSFFISLDVSRCVAVCRSVSQCVAVCCSVLQCGAVRCSVLQCVAV